MQNVFRWIGLAASACLLAGCTPNYPETAKVEGTVTLDGRPLVAGEVRFYAEHGGQASGPIHEDGNFRLTTFLVEDGAVLGTHTAVVVPPTDGSGSPLMAIPQKYQDPATSGLTYEVKRGMNIFEIPLESPDHLAGLESEPE